MRRLDPKWHFIPYLAAVIVIGGLIALIGGLGSLWLSPHEIAKAAQQESKMTVLLNKSTFTGKIVDAQTKLNGNICLVQVLPSTAKDRRATYPAIIDCELNLKAGDKVLVKDYRITTPSNLGDMVHIAEKITAEKAP